MNLKSLLASAALMAVISHGNARRLPEYLLRRRGERKSSGALPRHRGIKSRLMMDDDEARARSKAYLNCRGKGGGNTGKLGSYNSGKGRGNGGGRIYSGKGGGMGGMSYHDGRASGKDGSVEDRRDLHGCLEYEDHFDDPEYFTSVDQTGRSKDDGGPGAGPFPPQGPAPSSSPVAGRGPTSLPQHNDSVDDPEHRPSVDQTSTSKDDGGQTAAPFGPQGPSASSSPVDGRSPPSLPSQTSHPIPTAPATIPALTPSTAPVSSAPVMAPIPDNSGVRGDCGTNDSLDVDTDYDEFVPAASNDGPSATNEPRAGGGGGGIVIILPGPIKGDDLETDSDGVDTPAPGPVPSNDD